MKGAFYKRIEFAIEMECLTAIRLSCLPEQASLSLSLFSGRFGR